MTKILQLCENGQLNDSEDDSEDGSEDDSEDGR